jgi:hypothetical protein
MEVLYQLSYIGILVLWLGLPTYQNSYIGILVLWLGLPTYHNSYPPERTVSVRAGIGTTALRFTSELL